MFEDRGLAHVPVACGEARHVDVPVLREMVRLLVLAFAQVNAHVRAARRPARACDRLCWSGRQPESVKGEPRFRRRPRRRLLSARRLLQRCACVPSTSPTCATLRLASWTPIASTALDLHLLLVGLLLLRRLLRLLSLLRHTALLAMMRWRYRNSAVANRRALHSDYYSTTKKTANPLNEWWTTSKRGGDASARRFVRPRRRGACARRGGVVRAPSQTNRRNACGTGTSVTRA